MDPILDIARRHRLTVIEDAAQAHGAEYDGRRCGSIAEIGAFSFYPGKNLGAYGEGGAVTTMRADIAEKCRTLRSWGEEKRYEASLQGVQLQDGRHPGRDPAREAAPSGSVDRAAAHRCLVVCGGTAIPKRCVCRRSARGCRHVYHVFVVRSDARDELREAANEGRYPGQGSTIPFPCTCSRHTRISAYRAGDFPVAETVAREVVIAADLLGTDARTGGEGRGGRVEGTRVSIALAAQNVARVVWKPHGQAVSPRPAVDRGRRGKDSS
jgi:hypothetical protein